MQKQQEKICNCPPIYKLEDMKRDNCIDIEVLRRQRIAGRSVYLISRYRVDESRNYRNSIIKNSKKIDTCSGEFLGCAIDVSFSLVGSIY